MNATFSMALDVHIKHRRWGCVLALLLAGCSGGGPESNNPRTELASSVQVGKQFTATGTTMIPTEEQIAELYWWILGRKPDESGLRFWKQSGLSLEAVAVELQRSPELVSQHGWSQLGANTRNKIYVDAAASAERADGTEQNPYKTLAAAAKAVKNPSTTVFVKPGIYEGGFRTTIDGTSTIEGGYDGRIYWISTRRWGAKIVPASSSTKEADNTTAWTNTGDYVHIIGFEVDGSRSVDPSRDNWRQGIYTSGTRSAIRENYVHDIARWYPCSGGEGGAAINIDAHAKGGESDAIGNWVRDIGQPGDECIRLQGIYVSSSGSVINNVVYRAFKGAAIHLYHEANKVRVINNTVAASNVGIVVGTGGYRKEKVEHKDSLIYNNIAYDNNIGIEEYVAKDGIMGINHYRKNLLSQNTRDWGSMKNTAGDTQIGSPAFVSYAKSKLLPNFHLASQSAAIGSGTPVYPRGTDFDGRERSMPSAPCIGAYEHSPQ
jgi:hypothetical protein